MAYISRLSQAVTADANNSYSSNLAPNASFVGTNSSTLGVCGIQVSLKTDQDCLVYVEQTPGLTSGVGSVTTNGTVTLSGNGTKFLRDFAVGDEIYVHNETVRIVATVDADTSLTVTSAFSTSAGTQSYQFNPWDISDTYNYYAASGGLGITIQAVNSAERVRVKNIGGSTTTYFRLQTALCPIVEAVPRSLSEEGNLKIAIKEDTAIVSTLNSTTNIAGNTTFTGTFEGVVNQSGIQVILLYNQNTTLYIDQSIDGTNAAITDTFYGQANEGLSQSVASIAPYYRIRVKNQNISTQATGSAVSAKTAILNVLPRSLDVNGNLRVTSPMDEYGFRVENTPQGESRVVSPYRVVGKQFEFYGSASGGPDANFWSTYIANSATALVQGSQAVLTSGTNTAAKVVLYSTRKGRYVQANCMRFRANMQLGDTGTASNTRRWGAGNLSNYNFTVSVGTAVIGNVYTNNSQQFQVLKVTSPTSIECTGTGAPTSTGTLTFAQGPGSGNLTYTANAAQAVVIDGFWFQLAGTTFSVITSKGGSPSTVSSGSFNGDLGSVYAPTTGNTVYEIYWTNNKVYFIVGGVVLHTVSATTATLSNTLSLGCFMDNINSGSSTSVTLSSRSMGIARMGVVDTAAKWYYVHGVQSGIVLKSGPGKLNKVVVNGWVDGSTISLYDGVSATNPIALIAPTVTGNAHVEQPFTQTFDLDFYNGLYLVTANGATDCNVIYE